TFRMERRVIMKGSIKKRTAPIAGSNHINLVRCALHKAEYAGGQKEASAGLPQATLLGAMIGDIASVNFLLDRGVDINTRDENGRTPLMEAIFGGQIETVRMLIDRGADINLADCDGWTPLMEA